MCAECFNNLLLVTEQGQYIHFTVQQEFYLYDQLLINGLLLLSHSYWKLITMFKTLLLFCVVFMALSPLLYNKL